MKRSKLAVLPIACLASLAAATAAQAHDGAHSFTRGYSESVTLTGLPDEPRDLELCTSTLGCRKATVPGVGVLSGTLSFAAHGHGSNPPTLSPNTDCAAGAAGKWFRLSSIGGSRLDWVSLTFTDMFGRSTVLSRAGESDSKPLIGGTAYSVESGLCVGSSPS